MASSRLPGKILMPLGHRTVLDHVVHRTKQFSSQTIVCTSTDSTDDPVCDHCQRNDIVCIRGPHEDVFTRFRIALDDPRVERTPWFARVTSDCPVLSVTLAQTLIQAIGDGLDYISVEHSTLPRGLAIELIQRETFERIDPGSLDAHEREHVTLRLYEQPGRYRCLRIDTPVVFRHPELRLTLDYPEDYELLGQLFLDSDELTAEEAIGRLQAEPELRAITSDCVQKQPRS